MDPSYKPDPAVKLAQAERWYKLFGRVGYLGEWPWVAIPFALIAIVGWLPVFPMTRPLVTYSLWIAPGVFLLLCAATMPFVVSAYRLVRARKQYAQWQNIQAQLSALAQAHPELVALNSLLELTQAAKDADNSRRDFWVNIAVNVFFLCLGFVLSYILRRLGWLQ